MSKEFIYDSEGELLDSEGYPLEVEQSYSLVSEGDNIINEIISENDPDKLENLTKLFSLTQKKKQLARINKLSKLLDKVDDEVIDRFENNPQVIEDRDLYRYWQTTSDIVNNKTEDDISLPRVQINNQTNINVNQLSGLNRESRAKVLDVVNKILGEATSDVIDVEFNDNKED